MIEDIGYIMSIFVTVSQFEHLHCRKKRAVSVDDFSSTTRAVSPVKEPAEQVLPACAEPAAAASASNEPFRLRAFDSAEQNVFRLVLCFVCT